MFSPSSESDDSPTRSASGTEPSGSSLSEPSVSTFVIASYRHEPDRIGELAILPSSEAELVLGRGAPDAEPRVRFFRPQPGRLEPSLPLASPGLSRRQLELRPMSDAIAVRRVGRCPMRVNGVERDEALVRPGDTLAFRQELVLFCVQRPACPSPLRHFDVALRETFGRADSLGIVGESPATWFLRDELAFAAKSGRHVLIVGESGTGKELAARAIHRLSSRAERPFVARNAATLPPALLDAEMFGNLKNYPNPGMADRPGLVGQADGGFLFLDEIGELSVELQSHLLRVLDSGGEYQRLGESSSRRSDLRLIAATNRDPSELRSDLVARLTLQVEVPPLSERREDLPMLARHLVTSALLGNAELAQRFTEAAGGARHARIDSRLVELLMRRDYAGNTRELEALLWKAMSASDGDWIAYDQALAGTQQTAAEPATEGVSPVRNPEPSEDEVRRALAEARGNVSRASRMLGLSSRYALYRRLVKLGIEPEC